MFIGVENPKMLIWCVIERNDVWDVGGVKHVTGCCLESSWLLCLFVFFHLSSSLLLSYLAILCKREI
jgi:hypothetical protein